MPAEPSEHRTTPLTSGQDPLADDPVLDTAVLSGLQQLSELAGTDLLSSVVGIFRRESAAHLAVLERTVDDSPAAADPPTADASLAADDDPAGRALHQLRGSAGNLGARRVARTAGELEQLTETGERVGRLGVRRLAVELATALQELDRVAAEGSRAH